MTTNFPTSIDALVNPTATDSLATVNHAQQHANANDAIEAIETQIGTTSAPVLARLASPTFTGTVKAKPTSEEYPRAQISDSGKIWSQSSKFTPYTGTHNDQNVGYGTDTQVYIERNDLTSDLVTLRMNRFQAIVRDRAQVTSASGTFPLTLGTITLADVSGFLSAGYGTLFYEQYSNSLTTAGTLPAGWTDRTPFASPTQGFTVTSTGAYCSTNNAPSIATVDTGELSQEVVCQFSGTLQTGMGIVVRYNDIGGGAASWISVRYNATIGALDIYGIYRDTGGTTTSEYIASTATAGFSTGMYVKAILEDEFIAVYTGEVDGSVIEYSNPITSKIDSSIVGGIIANKLLSGTNAGLVQHGTTVEPAQRYTNFSVRTKKSFTYTGKTVTTSPAGTLTGVTCSTTKTFTAGSTTSATYTDLSPVNIVRAVDTIGAVIWRLKNVGGQHTTDNITMGGNDDAGDIGLVFQSDIDRSNSGLVFFGDDAPTDTPNRSSNRGTFLRRVAARLIRSGGRLHIAPSDLNNFAGTATSSGTPTAPHLGIGNVDTGLYLTTASGVDTLRVAVDGANVASFSSTGFNGALASTATATTQTVGDNSTKVATTAFVTTANQSLGTYTAYTPTFTNLTVGNGTLAAQYCRVNNFVHAFGSFTFGSSSVMSSNPWFTLPVLTVTAEMGAAGMVMGTVSYITAAGTVTKGTANGFTASSVAQFFVITTSGTYEGQTAPTATVPFTWTTGDIIRWNIMYKAA
jgi:hypothetical protein